MGKSFLRNCAIFLSLGAIVTLSSCSSSKVTNDRLVIGMETTYQPFNWTETKESEYTLPIYKTNEYADGYDIQVAKFLSKETGKKVEIHRMTWEALIPGLNDGEINMVLAGMSVTKERLQSIDFTDPYLTSDLAFLIQKSYIPEGNSSENPAKYEDLLKLFENKILICQQSVVGDDIIENYFVNNDQKISIKHASPAQTYPAAAQDVLSGNAFAMPAELPVVEAMTNLDTAKLGVLYVDYKNFLSADDITGLSVNIGIKKGNTELKDELNEALSKLTTQERNQMMGEASARSAENAH